MLTDLRTEYCGSWCSSPSSTAADVVTIFVVPLLLVAITCSPLVISALAERLYRAARAAGARRAGAGTPSTRDLRRDG